MAKLESKVRKNVKVGAQR